MQQSQPSRDAYTDELARLREILAAAPDAFVSVDAGGLIQEWNPAATALLGWAAAEIVGRSIETLLPVLSPAAGTLTHRDGHHVAVEAVVRPGGNGESYIFLKRPNHETPFLEAVLENLSDGVVACDGDGALTVFNPAAERLHGLPVEPLPPQEWAGHYDLLDEDGAPMQMEAVPLYRALRGEPVVGLPMVIAPHGQPPRTVLASGRQLRGEDGRVLGAVVSMRDVSEQRAAEERASRYTRTLMATLDAQRAVTAAVHDRGEVLRVVAGRAVDAFAAADGAVVELVQDGGALDYAAAAGTLTPHVGLRLPVAGSLSGVAMSTRVTVRCEDTATDPRVNREACERIGIGSMVIAPLFAADEAIGVLKVSSAAAHAFDDADQHQLELLATSLSAGLRHAEDYAHNETLLRERTEALAALEVSERRFRLSFDNSPVGMLLIDLRPATKGRFLQANPVMTDITGYPRETLAAMTMQDLVHPADVALSEQTMERFVGGEIDTAVVERRLNHAGGGVVWGNIRVGVIGDRDGRALYLVAQVEDITERRAAQAALERQARLLQLIPAPVIEHGLDGTIHGWNAGAETTYGYPAGTAIGLRVHDLLAIDGAGASDEIAKALRDEGHWTGELVQRGADGRRITVLSRQVLHHGLDRPETVLAVNNDITALRAAEQAVRASDQRLRAQFEHSAAGQVIRAPDGTWLEVNPAFAAMLGTTPEALVGVNVNELLHADDLPASHENITALLDGQVESVTSEGRLRRIDGAWLDYHSTISAVRDAAGVPLYLVVVITDITDRRNAERARDAAAAQLEQRNVELAAQRAHLNEILDIINVFVMTCDHRGNLVHLNRAGRSVPAGDPPTRIEHLHRVAPAGEAPRPGSHPLARALRGEVIEAAEMVLHVDGGRERALIVDARPLQDPGGAAAGAICTAFDVTALRDREAELAGFAGVVAHDLKNPLTGIIGFAEMAADLLQAAEPLTVPGVSTAARYMERAKENAQHMDQLIDDLLAFATARDAPLRPSWTDLAATVAHIVTVRTGHLPAPDRPDITAGPLPEVWADPGMLRQVLDNLVGNAVKYTRPGRRAQVAVTAERDGADLRITVADRGIGIPADQRNQVLSQFHRAHAGQGYAGTGLGLAIVQRVVDRHGGVIGIDDNPGGGTRITVTLPQPPPAPI